MKVTATEKVAIGVVVFIYLLIVAWWGFVIWVIYEIVKKYIL